MQLICSSRAQHEDDGGDPRVRLIRKCVRSKRHETNGKVETGTEREDQDQGAECVKGRKKERKVNECGTETGQVTGRT